MILDTERGRYAALDFAKPYPSLVLPLADGSIDQIDRVHLLHSVVEDDTVVNPALLRRHFITNVGRMMG